MSKGVNKVILLGHLGNDPDMRYTATGAAVATISLATNSSVKDKETGEWKDTTEWHRVVFFERLAEIAGQYLRKGSQVYVEGRLRTQKWQDNSGQDRYTTEVIAKEMQMVGGGGKGDSASSPPAAATKPTTQQRPMATERKPLPSTIGAPEGYDDDVPF